MSKLVKTACIRCGKTFEQSEWKANSKYRKKTCSVECCYKRNGTDEERFFRMVRKTATCWLWIGFKNDEEYGHFWYNRTTVHSHRWSYEHFIGQK